MPDNVTRLLTLAEAEFPDLTEPEREVVRCAATGEIANLSPLGPPAPPELKTSLVRKFNPGGRQLRSAVVEWLCTDAQAQELVHRMGMRIAYANLDEQINLNLTKTKFYILFLYCRFPGLTAQRGQFESSLCLKFCRVDGQINLLGTAINGQLMLESTRILNINKIAINGDGLTIKGGLFLKNRFLALGEVSLLGANISGTFDCSSGRFRNPAHPEKSANSAISTDGAIIDGNM